MRDFTPLSPKGLRPVSTHSWLLKGVRCKPMTVCADCIGTEAASTARRSCFCGWNRPTHLHRSKPVEMWIHKSAFFEAGRIGWIAPTPPEKHGGRIDPPVCRNRLAGHYVRRRPAPRHGLRPLRPWPGPPPAMAVPQRWLAPEKHGGILPQRRKPVNRLASAD